jgi:hypothetical protein
MPLVYIALGRCQCQDRRHRHRGPEGAFCCFLPLSWTASMLSMSISNFNRILDLLSYSFLVRCCFLLLLLGHDGRGSSKRKPTVFNCSEISGGSAMGKDVRNEGETRKLVDA